MKRTTLLIVILLLLASSCFGSAVQFEFLISGLTDTNGQMLNGGKVYTYTAGTSNAKTVWHDAAKASAWANPVVLDAYGRATVFGDGSYKIVITDSANTTLATIDGLTYVDPANPSALAPTTITCASGTFTTIQVDAGTISNVTISNATSTGQVLTTPTLHQPVLNGAIITGATATTLIIATGSSLASDLDAANHKITGLGTPTTASDSTTKAYVDAINTALTQAIATVSTNLSNVSNTLPYAAQIASLSFGTPYIPVIDNTYIMGTAGLASTSSWTSVNGICSINNTTVDDQYFVFALQGSELISVSTTASQATSVVSFLGLLDDAGIVYTVTKVRDVKTSGMVGYSLDSITEYPFSLTAVVKVAAGASKAFSLQHITSQTAGVNYVTVEMAPSSKWYRFWRIY